MNERQHVDAALDDNAQAVIIISETGHAVFGACMSKGRLIGCLQELIHFIANQVEYEQQLVQDLRTKLDAPGAVQDLATGPDHPVE